MPEFAKVYLAWRKGCDPKTHVVGLLEKEFDSKHTFRYLPEAKELYVKDKIFTNSE